MFTRLISFKIETYRVVKKSAVHQYITRAIKWAGHVARLERWEYIKKLVGEREERT